MSKQKFEHPFLHSLKNVVDCRLTVWMGSISFTGLVGESEDDEVMVLHTDNGMMDILISAISAIRYERSQA